MLQKIPETHSLYAIYLELSEESTIQVGKLGTFTFNKGIYVYVGSAKRNINARIRRHVEVEKKKKWHFDYLRPFGTIVKIITYERNIDECELAEKIRKKTNGVFPIKGFGSSDCRCFSHLIYYTDKKERA